ncbi:HslU--HslV peptidase proteolytic subunit, partial [Morganella morganii]|nr:HslU--HslV peptidase proteolytic subunit [Morganella morganii]
KGQGRKVRRRFHDTVIAGFAGGTADALTHVHLSERTLDHPQLHQTKAAVEHAKDWRTDRMLRRLEALLAVADDSASVIITGQRAVVQPE